LDERKELRRRGVVIEHTNDNNAGQTACHPR
jgi:hypothetical protein